MLILRHVAFLLTINYAGRQISRISSLQPKTSSGVRTVPMSETVYAALKRVLKKRMASKSEPIIDGYGGFLFLDKSGMPKVAMHLENYMRNLQKKAQPHLRQYVPSCDTARFTAYILHEYGKCR